MNLNDTPSTTPDTRYLARPEGRIGYDVAGTGPLPEPSGPSAARVKTATTHATRASTTTAVTT